MTGKIDRVEVIKSVQRRRRWSAEEKTRIVQETYAPGMSVSLVGRAPSAGAGSAVALVAVVAGIAAEDEIARCVRRSVLT
jgi:hypothetical protein